MNIYTARYFFYHSYKAVPLIATQLNDRALIMIKKQFKMRFRKGFENVNITNGLFFFERYSLITATVCAKIKIQNALSRVIQFVHIVAIMRLLLSKKNNPLFNNELINIKNSWNDHNNCGQQYTRITS